MKPKKTVLIIVLSLVFSSIVFCFLLFETTAIYDVDVGGFDEVARVITRPISVSEIARQIKKDDEIAEDKDVNIPSTDNPPNPDVSTPTDKPDTLGTQVDTICVGVPVYDGPTVSSEGRYTDTQPSFNQHNKSLTSWAMFMLKDPGKIGDYVKKRANGFQIKESTATDSEGRVLAGIGPGVTNPGRDPMSTPTQAEMLYGSKADVVLEKDGKNYYVPIIIAECKAHTYPSWVVQTGYSAKNGKLYFTGANLGDQFNTPESYDKAKADVAYTGAAAVEFVYTGDSLRKTSDYKMLGVIIY